ncbi:MAG TPA: molecular chaperone [Povalibacter sp.]|uniref:fimbrial biogenesis chaperone n=1 Tax=Povalibacter sp. TaxID=1962978 RepID=UPI002D0C00D4|nr:molecular chaperone [Povalibacter sp.]HMN43323.1 molecular chaperone [Povalibacter sp.]
MRTTTLAAAALLALLTGTASLAASIQVRPTTVILAGNETAASVTVTNTGNAPVTAQLRIFNWNQDGNEDRLDPTTAVAASPPMMTIAPGQNQTIRLVRVAKERATKEESYRLLVDEIADRTVDAGTTGVNIQLRYSVPVFVMPKTRAPARLSVTAKVADAGVVIDAVNRGDAHAQISKVSLTYADGTSQVLDPGLVGYVLPDKSRQWTLPLPASGSQGAPRSISAVVNGQEMQVRL